MSEPSQGGPDLIPDAALGRGKDEVERQLRGLDPSRGATTPTWTPIRRDSECDGVPVGRCRVLRRVVCGTWVTLIVLHGKLG